MPIVKFLRESYLTWQIPIKKLIKSRECYWSGGIKGININSWNLTVSRKIVLTIFSNTCISDEHNFIFINILRPKQNCCHFVDNILKFIFLKRNCCSLIQISLEFVFKDSIKQYASIGSDNGLKPVWHQAIIWTNDGLIYWCIYVSLSLNELMT